MATIETYIIGTKVPTDTYTYAVIVGVALAFVAVIVLFAFMFVAQQTYATITPIQSTTYVPLVPLETIYTDFGSTENTQFTQPSDANAFSTPTTCNATGRSEWDTLSNKCNCIAPYWGSACHRESYSIDYLSIGLYDPSLMTSADIGTTSPVSDYFSCMNLCDTTTDCNGVIYKKDTQDCTLFKTLTLTPPYNIPYKLGIDMDTYIKRLEIPSSLIYTDRVFVYSAIPPLRYWLVNEYKDDDRITGDNFLTVMTGRVFQVSFYPSYSISGNKTLKGVWSILPFTDADYNTLLSGGNTDTVYIHDTNMDLVVPAQWVLFPLWVMYQ